MKHAEKVEMLERIKRDIAYAESQRDLAQEGAGATKKVGEREWHRGVGTAWASIREKLLSLQRFVVSLPIDDLDTILASGQAPAPAKPKPKRKTRAKPRPKKPLF